MPGARVFAAWRHLPTEGFVSLVFDLVDTEVAASPLARRPYDLRHAAVSTWLNGGVPPTDVAAWAGQSTEILFRIYAKCLDGGKETLRRRVDAALGYRTNL